MPLTLADLLAAQIEGALRQGESPRQLQRRFVAQGADPQQVHQLIGTIRQRLSQDGQLPDSHGSLLLAILALLLAIMTIALFFPKTIVGLVLGTILVGGPVLSGWGHGRNGERARTGSEAIRTTHPI